MKNIKEGDKVVILPYEYSRLCPLIDAAIEAKTAFEVKGYYGESAVIINVGGKDRVFGEHELNKEIEEK